MQNVKLQIMADVTSHDE